MITSYEQAYRWKDAPIGKELEKILDAKGIKDVVIVGAMSHMYIDATARAAADYGFNVTVVGDATATRDVEFNGMTVSADQVHAAFLSALGFAYAKVVTAEDVSAPTS